MTTASTAVAPLDVDSNNNEEEEEIVVLFDNGNDDDNDYNINNSYIHNNYTDDDITMESNDTGGRRFLDKYYYSSSNRNTILRANNSSRSMDDTATHNNYDDDDDNDSRDTRDEKFSYLYETFQTIKQKNKKAVVSNSSDNEDEYILFKRKEIIECLSSSVGITTDTNATNPPIVVDLWKLRELAIQKGGFIDSDLRKRVWPLLLSFDTIQQHLAIQQDDEEELANHNDESSTTSTNDSSDSSCSNSILSADMVALQHDFEYRKKTEVEKFVLFHIISSFLLQSSTTPAATMPLPPQKTATPPVNTNATKTTPTTTTPKKNSKKRCLNNNNATLAMTPQKMQRKLQQHEQTHLSPCRPNRNTITATNNNSNGRHRTPVYRLDHNNGKEEEKKEEMSNVKNNNTTTTRKNDTTTNHNKYHYYNGLVDLTSILLFNLDGHNNNTNTAIPLTKIIADTTQPTFTSSTTLLLQRLAEVHLQDAFRVTTINNKKSSPPLIRSYDRSIIVPSTTTTAATANATECNDNKANKDKGSPGYLGGKLTPSSTMTTTFTNNSTNSSPSESPHAPTLGITKSDIFRQSSRRQSPKNMEVDININYVNDDDDERDDDMDELGSPGSLCRQFLVNSTPIEKGSLLTFLSLLQTVNIDAYQRLIHMCQKYYPNDGEVIVTGLQTVATVLAYYVSTWFVTAVGTTLAITATVDDFDDNLCNVDTNNNVESSSPSSSANQQTMRRYEYTNQNNKKNNNKIASRLVDFFLVSHPLMPVYFAVSLFAIRSDKEKKQWNVNDNYANENYQSTPSSRTTLTSPPDGNPSSYHKIDNNNDFADLENELRTWFQFPYLVNILSTSPTCSDRNRSADGDSNKENATTGSVGKQECNSTAGCSKKSERRQNSSNNPIDDMPSGMMSELIEELIEESISYIKHVPPSDLIAMATETSSLSPKTNIQRPGSRRTLDDVLGRNEIAFLQPYDPPSWMIASYNVNGSTENATTAPPAKSATLENETKRDMPNFQQKRDKAKDYPMAVAASGVAVSKLFFDSMQSSQYSCAMSCLDGDVNGDDELFSHSIQIKSARSGGKASTTSPDTRTLDGGSAKEFTSYEIEVSASSKRAKRRSLGLTICLMSLMMGLVFITFAVFLSRRSMNDSFQAQRTYGVDHVGTPAITSVSIPASYGNQTYLTMGSSQDSPSHPIVNENGKSPTLKNLVASKIKFRSNPSASRRKVEDGIVVDEQIENSVENLEFGKITSDKVSVNAPVEAMHNISNTYDGSGGLASFKPNTVHTAVRAMIDVQEGLKWKINQGIKSLHTGLRRKVWLLRRNDDVKALLRHHDFIGLVQVVFLNLLFFCIIRLIGIMP